METEGSDIMNGRQVKKLKKEARKQWRRYIKDIRNEGFSERVNLAWWVLFGK